LPSVFDRLLEALQGQRPGIFYLDATERQSLRPRSDQHLTGRRVLLQTNGHVDRLPGRKRRILGVDENLSGLHPRSRLEAELVEGREDAEPGPDGSLGIVFMCLRDPEGGHHGVACVLPHRAAVSGDALADVLEETGHTTAYDLGIVRSHEPRRVDEID